MDLAAKIIKTTEEDSADHHITKIISFGQAIDKNGLFPITTGCSLPWGAHPCWENTVIIASGDDMLVAPKSIDGSTWVELRSLPIHGSNLGQSLLNQSRFKPSMASLTL